MSLANMIRRMGEAGATPEAIAIAVEEIEGIQIMLDARRATDRDRKRVQRERQKTADVTGHSEDSPRTVTDKPSPLCPPLKSPPNPQKITPPISPQPVVVARARGACFAPPEGVTSDQFSAFCKQRKKKLTDHAYSLLCGKLKQLAEHGYPPGEMIDLAIERGWETVFEPKEYRNGRPQRPDSLRGSRPSPALDMWRQANADIEAERGNTPTDFGTRLALPPIRPG